MPASIPRRVASMSSVHLAGHAADGPGAGAVGMPAVDDAADVDADQVAIGEPTARRWDAVDDLVIDAGADARPGNGGFPP